MMKCMQADARDHAGRAEPPAEQRVEVGVQEHERGAGGDRRTRSRGQERDGARDCGGRAQAMPPAEVERARRAAALQQQLDPRNPAPREVSAKHARERPRLQVRALDRRVEPDRPARRREPHSELDVLDRRLGVARRVETALRLERRLPDGAEPGPERRGFPRGGLVDVMVEQISEARDHPAGCRGVVVGAEEHVEAVVIRERPPDPGERVAVDDDVGVDEHEHVSPGPLRALVPRGRRPRGGRPVDDDHLVRRLGGRLDRGETRGERRRRVRCGHDRAQGGHAPILHGIYVAPMQCGLQGGHGRTGLQGPFRAGTG